MIDFDAMKKSKSKGRWFGTAGWTAPELKWNCDKNTYSFANDIWSFGLVILHCILGEQPLNTTMEDRKKYGVESAEDWNNNPQRVRELRADWVGRLPGTEKMLRNFLVKLYYDGKISLDLFELLFNGILVYDPKKRWNCERIYYCKWFEDIHEKKKKR